jgi:hypothetical protein
MRHNPSSDQQLLVFYKKEFSNAKFLSSVSHLASIFVSISERYQV